MYARRLQDSRDVYIAVGYTACVIVAIILFNALIRLFWNLVQRFQDCYDDVKAEAVKV